MLQKIYITNHKNETLEINLFQPEKSGLNIRKIEGIGPVKASITTTDISSGDGKFYNNARKSSREIKFQIGLTMMPTIEDCRHKIYQYFPTKQKIKVRIVTDKRDVYTYGYIEENDPDIFSDDETVNVNIVCPNPYFQSTKGNNFEMANLFRKFEFAATAEERQKVWTDGYSMLENNSLVNKLIEFGYYGVGTEYVFAYDGENDTGVIFTIHAIGRVDMLTLVKVNTNESMEIDTTRLPDGYMKSGDTIEICTVNGNKYCTLTRDGVVSNIIGCLERGTTWLQFSQGENTFSYAADSGAENVQISVKCDTLFEGI